MKPCLSMNEINFTKTNTQKCEKPYSRLRIPKYITFFKNVPMRIHTATHDEQRTWKVNTSAIREC